ncbi:MAG: menaquinone biosynthesis protein [Verrucomicrobia bacterium]|nr:menaquinone biosynthesis protein [Verrucomicrobiota bacterium]
MRTHKAKQAARIGCVPYLNAKPLIYGLEKEVALEHPARLAQRLAARELDTALVPVVEVFRRPDYVVVDGIAIACRGPVYSVILAHRAPLQALREVVVDASSGASALLLKVLLQKRFGLKPRYVTESLADKPSTADAQMLIGDQAIRFRQTIHGASGRWQILDLGQAWFEWTGLPFVFAVWAAHADCLELPALVRKLAAARTAGCAHIEEIIAREQGGDAAFRRRYFAGNVRFRLGDREKAAMRLFQRHLLDLGELKEKRALRFI